MKAPITWILAGIASLSPLRVVSAADCVLPATVEYRGSSVTKTKTGHIEYQPNGTSVPKRYLVETISESAEEATLSGSGYTSGDITFTTADSRSRTPVTGTATYAATLTWPPGTTAYLSFRYRSGSYNYVTVLDSTDFGGSTSGSGSYGGSYSVPERAYFQMTGSYGDYASGTVEWEPDDTPGTQTSTYTYDSGPAVEDHNGGLELYSGSLSTSVTIDSPTAKHYDTTSSYLPARRLYTLSDEYTTPELESYARGFLTQDGTWGQPIKTAIRALATNELSITVQNCQARIAWQSKPLQDYLVRWEEVTTLTGQVPVRVKHEAYVAGNGYAPMQFETPWVQPPAGNGTINICKLQVTPVAKCDDCDVAWSPGVGQFEADGAQFGFDLGAADFGRPSGRLSVSSLLPSVTLSTPASLTFRGNTNLTDVVEVGGTLRQAFSGEHLADVVTNDAFSYQIRFFSAQNVLGKVAGLYVTQNDPYTTWHIRNPNGALDTNELLVVEERDGSWNTNHYQYHPGSNTWELTRGNGFRRETVETVWDAGSLTETKIRKVFDAGDALTSEKHEIYTLTTNGLFLTSEVFDPNRLNLVTTHTYDTYGRPVTRDEHSGYWEQRTYDTSGRLATLTQVRNNRTNILYASESVLRTDYAYTPASGSGDDGAIAPLTPRTTVVYDTDDYKPATLARTYIVLTNGFRQDIGCRDAAAAWTDANNLVTTTRYYTNGPFKDFVHTIDHPDQTRTVFFYESNATQRTTTRIEGAADPSSATNILTGVQSILVQGTRGETLLSETYFKNSAAQVILTDRQVYEYLDELKLSHRVISHNGTTQTVQYGCCGLESIQSPDGTLTEFFHNPLRQHVAVRVMPHNLTVTNTLDGEGRVLQSRLVGASQVVDLTGVAYDGIGRPLFVTNALGGVTSYSYSQDTNKALRVVAVQPDGGVVTHQFARDGTLVGQSGSATFPRIWKRWSYGSSSSSKLPAVAVFLLDEQGFTNQWTRQISDRFGRPAEVAYNMGGSIYSSSSAYETFSYNALGQRTNTKDADNVYQNFSYNSRGELETTSLNRGGGSTTIDYTGTDSITKTVSDVTYRGTNPVWRTDTYVWPTLNVDASNLVSTVEQSTDGLQTWSTLWNNGAALTTHTSVTLDPANGLAVTTTTRPDQTYTISTNQYGRLLSTTEFDADDGILGQQTYSHDDLGRVQSVTDLRNGTTSYTYNGAGQVTSVTTPAPGQGQSPLVTSNLYDTLGRLTRSILPDGSSVTNEYFFTGLLKKRSGSQQYPVEYTYDAQGRVKTVVTWGDAGPQTNRWEYDANRGWLKAVIYPDGRSNWFARTLGGKVDIKYITPRPGYASTYLDHDYNSDGTLKFAKWYNEGNSAMDLTSITYTRLGQVQEIQSTAPGGSAGYGPRINRQYDMHGNITGESYAYGPLAGMSVTNRYDSLLRRTNSTALKGSTVLASVNYAYDNASRLDQVTDGAVSAAFGYLPYSPLLQSVQFRHQGTNVMTTTRSYDFLDRLTSIASTTAAFSSSAAYGHNALNKITTLTNAGGDYWVYQYDAKGQVTAAGRHWDDGSLVAGQQYEFAFDDIGNPALASKGGTSIGTDLRTSTASFNNLNQFTSRTVPGYAQSLGSAHSNATVTVNLTPTERKGEYFRGEVTFDNSAAPVWSSLTNTAVLSNVLSSEVLQQFIAKTPETFAYDAEGNLTNDGRWTYVWGADNRLLSMETDTDVPTAAKRKLAFDYDPLGRRVQSEVQVWNPSTLNYELSARTKFVYDGWNLVAELNATNDTPLRTYAWAGGFDSLLWLTQHSTPQPSTHFVAYDGNANVRALVEAGTGESSAEYEYGPFGDVIRATGPMALKNPIRFSSKYQDPESGLFYYGHRYYSAQHRKWPSRDPIGYEGGLNLYGFVGNDPISYSDPDGRFYLSAYNRMVGRTFQGFANNTSSSFLGGLYTGISEASYASANLTDPIAMARALWEINQQTTDVFGQNYEVCQDNFWGAAYQASAFGLGRLTGVGGLAEGWYGVDLYSGEGLSTLEQWSRGLGGVGGTMLFAAPALAQFKFANQPIRLRIPSRSGLNSGPKLLTLGDDIAGTRVPADQVITRMARPDSKGKTKQREFQVSNTDLTPEGRPPWNDNARMSDRGLSINLTGPDPNLTGTPFTTTPRAVETLSEGRLKVVHDPIPNNPNHALIVPAEPMTQANFKALLKQLYTEGVWK